MAELYLPDYSRQLNQLGQTIGGIRRQNALASVAPQALSGDGPALNRLAMLDPSMAATIQQNQYTRQRQETADKSASDAARREIVRGVLTDGAGMIVNMPEAELPNAWTGIRAQMIQQAPELATRLPEQYDPSVLATAKGLAGMKPAAPAAPTDDMREFEFAQQNPEFAGFLRSMKQAGAPSISYGGFSAAIDPQGNPVYIQPSNRGGAKVAEGFRPFSADATAQREVAEAKKGGALDAEKSAARPKVQASLTAAEVKADNVIAEIDRVLPSVGVTTAGPLGATLSGIPGTPARDVRALVDTIKANIGFQELSEMRANSPTGGALGNVTERELAFLQSVISNLEQAQSPDQLKQNLQNVRKAMTDSKQRLRAAYEMDYSGDAQPQGATSPEQQPTRKRFNPQTGRIE